jgi:hypothetical protein
MVAPQLEPAPCSSSFSPAFLSAMLSATKVTMSEHQVLSSLIQIFVLVISLLLHETSP